MNLIQEIQHDQKEGTSGPWCPGHFADIKHACECKYVFAEMDVVATVSGEKKNVPKSASRANLRRIARVPELEEAVSELATILEEYLEFPLGEVDETTYLKHVAVLRKYKRNTKG